MYTCNRDNPLWWGILKMFSIRNMHTDDLARIIQSLFSASLWWLHWLHVHQRKRARTPTGRSRGRWIIRVKMMLEIITCWCELRYPNNPVVIFRLATIVDRWHSTHWSYRLRGQFALLTISLEIGGNRIVSIK